MQTPPGDLVIALMGASVALAGLLLVFSGFLFAQAASFPPETPDGTINRFRCAGKAGVGPFVACIVDAGVSLRYLLVPSETALWCCWFMFALALVATGVYGAFVILRYL